MVQVLWFIVVLVDWQTLPRNDLLLCVESHVNLRSLVRSFRRQETRSRTYLVDELSYVGVDAVDAADGRQ